MRDYRWCKLFDKDMINYSEKSLKVELKASKLLINLLKGDIFIQKIKIRILLCIVSCVLCLYSKWTCTLRM